MGNKRIARYKLFFYAFLALPVFRSTRVHAQGVRERIGLKGPLREINITGKSLNSFLWKVTNLTDTAVSLRLKVVPDDRLQILSQKDLQVHLLPHDSIFVPVNVYSPGNMPKGSYPIRIEASEDKRVLGVDTCWMAIRASRNVSLLATEPDISLYGNEHSLDIPIKVINSGNTTEKVTIVASYPAEDPEVRFHKPLQLTLSAFSDTLIWLKKPLQKSLTSQDNFYVTVSGLYENGDIFGQTGISVQLLKSARYFKSPDLPLRYINNYPNSVTVGMQNLTNQYAYYTIDGGGDFLLPSGKLGYNTDAFIPQQNLSHGTYIRNTYLGYESHNMGVTVGNLNRSFDLNIYGRGAAAFFRDTAHKNYYEAGAMDNSGNLLAEDNGIYSSGRAAWGSFRHQLGENKFSSALVYQKDPFLRAENILLANEMDWVTRQKYQFNFQLNASNTTDYTDPSLHKPGWLATVNMNKTFGKLSLSSANTYSSAYYAGLRKGSRLFSERAAYTEKKIGLWAALNSTGNQPKYLSSFFRSFSYGQTRAEAGISTHIGKFSFSFSPYHSSEHSTYSVLLNDQLHAKLDAWRAATQVNYTSPGASSFFISTDAGAARNSLMNNNEELQCRISASYHYGSFFMLNSMIQFGSFYTGEALSAYLFHLHRYRSVQIMPMLQKNLLQNKLSLRASISYNYTSISLDNWIFDGEADYRLSPKTSLTIGLNSNKNYSETSSFNNLSVRLTQRLPEGRVGISNNTLTVQLFKDENGNGVFDKGDSLAQNFPVSINSDFFVTDNKGMVRYENLPAGSYNVSTPGISGWYTMPETVLLNKKKQTLTLALRKTGTVTGSISYLFTEFGYETPREKFGITITAVDENGSAIKAQTDDSGNFLFYLPAGTYTIYIDQKDMPQQTECANNNQKLTVTSGSYKKINFILRVKDRKIQVKKFTSLSMNK